MQVLLKYQPDNKQEDYMFIGKSVSDGKLHAGYLVVDRKWFVDINNCDHYIYKNRYKDGGLSGGLIDIEGFDTIKVDPKSIRPYDQIAQIMLAQEQKINVLIVKSGDVFPIEKDGNVIAKITPDDDLPLHLYTSDN